MPSHLRGAGRGTDDGRETTGQHHDMPADAPSSRTEDLDMRRAFSAGRGAQRCITYPRQRHPQLPVCLWTGAQEQRSGELKGHGCLIE
jgi:hypothetical protein